MIALFLIRPFSTPTGLAQSGAKKSKKKRRMGDYTDKETNEKRQTKKGEQKWRRLEAES